ncbi:hypothetical protein [Bdellovibrio bacteriovorus]|uniref:hypothetical protein n=1 Tax=Bdellovibrio bacteriovorus TaxID=959 RepID=UPI0035A5A06C
MSSFDDLKEKLVSDARVTWERIQESGAYNQLRDRYENMTPAMQKLTLVGGVALVSLIILSIPYGKYTQSNEYVSEFESKRMTIRELLKVSRESSEVPQIPQAPSMDMIRNNIDNQIKAANLLPEQIKGTEIQENNSNLVPKNLTEGLFAGQPCKAEHPSGAGSGLSVPKHQSQRENERHGDDRQPRGQPLF